MSLTLEDSTTYQYILEKGIAQGIAQGRAQEAQSLIMRQGTKRFGAPTPEVEAAIRATTDQPRFERLAERVLDATSWADLLATP